MKIGAQLYTLRDSCTNLEDFRETLHKVADMGYTTVQVSGTCDWEADWLADVLKETGLTCPITHYKADAIREDTLKTVEKHRKIACKYIGLGGAPAPLNCEENYEKFVTEFRGAIHTIAEEGGLFMYHNHYMEFTKDQNGLTYLERLAKDFSPKELGFTLDTYWVQYSGGNPAKWLEKFAGRVPCIHLKDMAVMDGKPVMAAVGQGNIDFEDVINSAQKAGTEYLLVEQDHCNGEDPFVCLKRSCDYLKKLGLN